MCGKCDAKNGGKDPEPDVRILETRLLEPAYSVNTSEVGPPGPIDEDQIENRHNDAEDLRGPGRVMTNPRSIKETRVARREKERPAQAERRSTITTDWSPIAR